MGSRLSLYRNYTNSDSVFVKNTYSVFPNPSELGWAKEGCVFKYWNFNKDGSASKRYNVGDSVPMVMLSDILYAIWEEVYTTTGNELKSVADAIRTKGGTSELLAYPSGFISAIENLPSGGGGTAKTVTVSLSFGSSTSYFRSCNIYETTDGIKGEKIGEILSVDGSATVIVSETANGFVCELRGGYVTGGGTAWQTVTGGVALLKLDDSANLDIYYVCIYDGTADINFIGWDD